MDKPSSNAYFCYDCKGVPSEYMVKDEVWRAAFPDYNAVKATLMANHQPPADLTCSECQKVQFRRACHVWLCLHCLGVRLGRSLTANDFKLDAPINGSLVLGMRLGMLAPEDAAQALLGPVLLDMLTES